MTIGCVILDIGFVAIINCCDWNKIAAAMRLKMMKDAKSTSDMLLGNVNDISRTPTGFKIRKEVEKARSNNASNNVSPKPTTKTPNSINN